MYDKLFDIWREWRELQDRGIEAFMDAEITWEMFEAECEELGLDPERTDRVFRLGGEPDAETDLRGWATK